MNRPLGAEIELSSHTADLHARRVTFPHTQVAFVPDGSIQGEHPVEMVIGPVVGSAFKPAMREVGAWLTANAAQANETCGLHVHIGATDLGGFELRRVLNLYHVCEDLFYSLCGEGRAEKKHSKCFTPAEWEIHLACRSATTSSEIRRAILPAVYPGYDQRSAQRRKSEKYDKARYRGLNLHSYFYRGTLEFRQHEGCVDMARISRWMQFCGWFVELASRLTDREIAAIQRPEDFLLGVWKRQYGLLALPAELVAYAQAGRAQALPVPTPLPTPLELGIIADRLTYTQRMDAQRATLYIQTQGGQ